MSTSGRVTKFGLRNFKAFRYLEDLELRPLTVLVGANSSGKSSTFQALLLLKQSSEAGESDPILEYNGDLVKLGNFAMVVSDGDTTREIEMRFEVVRDLHDLHGATTRAEIKLAFGESAGPVLPTEVHGVDILRSLLEDRLEHLGPVRADPRAFYPVDDDVCVGPRGEGTIPYLLRHQHDVVSYAPSPVDPIREAPLLEAVNDWLRRMKVAASLTIDPLEAVAHTAAIKTSTTTRSVNLAQVGFGISQLLPVLVMGLKGPSDGWLLFEQPESQLHPRLQAEIGDFFLASARAGRTVMVETHSDHLVNRLRRRIAEDETGELAKLVQILFVHGGTDEDPGSYVEPLAIDPDTGAIVNCPPDFFSETADEAFAILEARRRRCHPPT